MLNQGAIKQPIIVNIPRTAIPQAPRCCACNVLKWEHAAKVMVVVTRYCDPAQNPISPTVNKIRFPHVRNRYCGPSALAKNSQNGSLWVSCAAFVERSGSTVRK